MDRVRRFAGGIGLDVSERTVRRVLMGEVRGAEEVSGGGTPRRVGDGGVGVVEEAVGPVMRLTEDEVRSVAGVLRLAADARYLRVGEVGAESRAGEITLKIKITEPEEEYE